MSLRSGDKNCPLFGCGAELPASVLPSHEDMMKYFIYVSQSTEQRFQNLVRDTSEIVATKIENIWKRASLPIVEHRTILARLKDYHEKYRAILKPYKGRKHSESYLKKLDDFKRRSKTLFDIAACKCTSFENCFCAQDRKVPIKERHFLIDQRGDRKMMIGSLDRKTTKQNESNMLRKLKRKLYQETQQTSLDQPSTSRSTVLSLNNVDLPTDEQYFAASTSSSYVIKPTDSGLSVVSRTLDRYSISDRAGAAIVCATLQDIGLVTTDNLTNVIDRNMIRRARAKTRTTLTAINQPHFDSCICISFDGRKDKTLIMEDGRRKVVIEEHISLLKEPGSQYIGHIGVKFGDAKTIAHKLFAYFVAKSIDLACIVAIGCDGTAVNTGAKAGIIRLLEGKLHRPLQWFVCQLHANELSLRHLFEYLDGTTTGPRSFSGQLGKLLQNCEHLPVIEFQAVECNLPDITKSRDDLSTDQLYLLEMCQAIAKGQCDENLAKRKPGKICHSRWLTTANTILRLYISTKNPTENQVILTEFVLRVYAPMWFKIKTQPSCVYGARHLHETIKLSRYLPEHLKKVVDPVIQRNGYFGHSENILISMLNDERKQIRELALRRILSIRERTSGFSPIRVFKLPTFNFNAADYIDLIYWEKPSEPPLIKLISSETIIDAIADHEIIESNILCKFRLMPCHTQATERCIKVVTASCSAVCGPERREGWIRNKLESCRIMPVFNSKKDYKTQ